MIETFLISRKLNRAYVANSFIYWLKSIPLVKRIVPYSEYKGGLLKTIAQIYSIVKDITTFCIAEFIYIACMYFASVGISDELASLTANQVFANVFFLFALIGIFLNNVLFEATKDRYYSIFLMRMDARKLVLSDFIYKLIRKFIGNSIAFVPVVILGKFNPILAVLFVLITVFGKFFGAYVKLKFVEKNKLGVFSNTLFGVIAVILVACGLITFNSIAIPNGVMYVVCFLIIFVSAYCAYRIFTYKKYRNICRFFLNEETVFAMQTQEKRTEGTKKNASNAISFDESDTIKSSNKSGYAYFHELFVRRHKKILWKRTKLISIIIASLGAGTVGTLLVLDKVFGALHEFGVAKFLFFLPLIFYFINTGESLASAMFANCDLAMLSYNFYRKPEVILGTFRQRLKTVVVLNIVPALLIALLLSGVCAFSSNKGDALAYLAIWITCISLSVFFSVHRLVIYYLLQPFTEGLETKRGSYSLANGLTYFVSYTLIQLMDDFEAIPLVFGVIVAGFSVLYVVVSLILVYKLAPKRFRVHK